MKIKDIVFCGISSALLCVLCPITLPVSAVPISLATLIIYITAALGKPLTSLISILLYIGIGIMGLPVFSGFSAGPANVLGPTGGFIIGYIPLTLCVSVFNKSRKSAIIGMCIGTLVLYLFGCVGYMISVGGGFLDILSVCVLPFLPVDIIKIIIAAISIKKLNIIINKN